MFKKAGHMVYSTILGPTMNTDIIHDEDCNNPYYLG